MIPAVCAARIGRCNAGCLHLDVPGQRGDFRTLQRILGGTSRGVYRVGAGLVLVAGCLAWLTPQHLAALLALHALWAAAVFGMGELAGRNILSPARCGQVSSAVGILVLPAIVGADVFVAVPGLGIAEVDLDHADAALDEAAGEDRKSVV